MITCTSSEVKSRRPAFHSPAARGQVRGTYGADEYPFLIGERGISVLPLTSLELTHHASTERMPTGVPDLDGMLEGKGYYRGSTVLVSGGVGSGKT
ncbi:MAG: hypothetical protein ACRD3O_19905, partial [Terriglobia bacterium]